MHYILTKITKILLLALLLAPLRSFAQINTDQVIRVGQNALYFEDYVLSIQYFNQAIQAKPYLAQPYLLRAIAKFNLDDWRGAEADASKAIELNPFLPDAWEVRGVARQNLQKNAEAVGDYDRALGLLPRNRQLMFNRAMALSEMDDFAAADSAFTQILEYYPNYDNAYLGRAKLRLEQADTAAAAQDIDRALEINPNTVNGYILRADISINQRKDYENALKDMNEAIKLEPRLAGLYINRAFLRHELNDYFGAMADYDYSLQLDPNNLTALFNRGLLRMEVSDNDLALADFNMVVNLDPDNYRALYNRAIIEGYKHDFKSAIDDMTKVIDRFPDFAGAYYMRSEYHEAKGDIASARRDYNKAMDLTAPGRNLDKAKESNATPKTAKEDVPEELVARRFNNLLTIANETHINEEYNNSAIRGKVQNHDLVIELEPMMQLSFYSSPTELSQNAYYIKEVDDINATHLLRRVVTVTSRPPQLLDEEAINKHFASIDYYNSYFATHTPRAADYFGRAMDQVTLRNYQAAIDDLTRAIAAAPDFSLAYQLRAQARYMAKEKTDELRMVLSDLDETLRLSPRNAVAWFNKGNVLYDLGDYTSAISAYTQAISLQPDMGEAYYNRGYIYFKLGNESAGIADLSKAGELGIISAYNLIKRITR